jgi:hypothetical protein
VAAQQAPANATRLEADKATWQPPANAAWLEADKVAWRTPTNAAWLAGAKPAKPELRDEYGTMRHQ